MVDAIRVLISRRAQVLREIDEVTNELSELHGRIAVLEYQNSDLTTLEMNLANAVLVLRKEGYSLDATTHKEVTNASIPRAEEDGIGPDDQTHR